MIRLPRAQLTLQSRALAVAAQVLASLALLSACGDNPGPAPAAAPPPLEVRVFEELPPLPTAERAAYAFERLVRGPKPVGGLPVEDIHRQNLDLAMSDLLALEDDTLAILEDPAVIERYVSMARRNADPWHNILRVLLALPSKPADLVLAWTRPVLSLDPGGPLATLRREAARVLATVPDVRVAETLLAIYEADPAEREMSVLCVPALLRMGSPWRERALQVALEGGPPSLWSDAPTRIGSLVPIGEVDPRVSDLMAWWGAYVAGSGPRISHVLPRVKNLPWSPARLALDDAVPHTPEGARALPGAIVYGPLPSSITHGTGWLPDDLSASATFPMYAYILTGKVPAAEARCALAIWHYPTYLHSVTADLGLETEDAALYWTARHCMADLEVTGVDVHATLRAELDRKGPWTPERVGGMRRMVASLPGCTAPEDWDLLVRVLREMRPLDEARTVLERAFDDMQPREPDLVPIMESLLASSDTEDRGVALHLIRRSREPVYLDGVERWLAATEDPDEITLLRRTLAWMYAQGRGIEPARYAAFVQRYVDWLSDMGDREASTFATGLLDFGEAGEEAFAHGLQGQRRRVYLAAWPRDRRIVSRRVAEAALAPVDAGTAPGEVALLLALAYGSFPDTAASALEALRSRLPQTGKELVAPVLERVRNRATRPGRG